MKFALQRRVSARFFAALACAFVAAALLGACAGDRAIREAEAALAAAREVHAEYLSPGEYRSAENWLAEARVRLRAADYDGAQSYAEYATSLAGRAAFNASRYGIDPAPVAKPSAPPREESESEANDAATDHEP